MGNKCKLHHFFAVQLCEVFKVKDALVKSRVLRHGLRRMQSYVILVMLAAVVHPAEFVLDPTGHLSPLDAKN